MSHSPGDIIRHLLIANGLGVLPIAGQEQTLIWPIFASIEPPIPDNCVTVFTTDGSNDGRIMQGPMQGHAGFQVRVRSRSEQEGWNKASDIQDFLQTVVRVRITIDTDDYCIHSCNRIGDVVPLGLEVGVSKRRLFVFNATTAYR